jgi:hypothetical protein
MKNTKKHTTFLTMALTQHIPMSKKKNARRKTNIKKKKISTHTSKKTPTPPKKKTLSNTFYNKKTILCCGDIETNPGPKFTLLLNHPQIHQEKHNTYFYKNSIQIKIEYDHIFESFKPYLNHTHTENTNPHLLQFCINNQQHPQEHLFFAILITLTSTPPQCNQLISVNSTQWTNTLLNKIINNPTPLPTEPHALKKNFLDNPHITKPLDSIQNEIYSFITTERPNLETLSQKFP